MKRAAQIALGTTLGTGLLLAPTLAIAATAGEHHEPSWNLTILGFVNFALFLFVLYRYAWPLVRDYLVARRESIVRALEAARRAQAEAEELRAEYEARMRTLEDEAARTREELLAIARHEADRVIDQARRAAERIRRDAELVAGQEVAQARALLQRDVAELITRLAGALIEREITPDDQRRLIREFVGEMREVGR
jgi:F-type H+-transporting ATPase subunit b